jgi:hypothetical protein
VIEDVREVGGDRRGGRVELMREDWELLAAADWGGGQEGRKEVLSTVASA